MLRLILAGVSNRDAAAQLQVSVRTVESRRAKLYRKMEVRHMTELVRAIDRREALRIELYGPSP